MRVRLGVGVLVNEWVTVGENVPVAVGTGVRLGVQFEVWLREGVGVPVKVAV